MSVRATFYVRRAEGGDGDERRFLADDHRDAAIQWAEWYDRDDPSIADAPPVTVLVRCGNEAPTRVSVWGERVTQYHAEVTR